MVHRSLLAAPSDPRWDKHRIIEAGSNRGPTYPGSRWFSEDAIL